MTKFERKIHKEREKKFPPRSAIRWKANFGAGCGLHQLCLSYCALWGRTCAIIHSQLLVLKLWIFFFSVRSNRHRSRLIYVRSERDRGHLLSELSLGRINSLSALRGRQNFVTCLLYFLCWLNWKSLDATMLQAPPPQLSLTFLSWSLSSRRKHFTTPGLFSARMFAFTQTIM